MAMALLRTGRLKATCLIQARPQKASRHFVFKKSFKYLLLVSFFCLLLFCLPSDLAESKAVGVVRDTHFDKQIKN